MSARRVGWKQLRPGDIVQIEWRDHHGWFRTAPPRLNAPIIQRTTAKVKEVSRDGVVVIYDETVPWNDEWQGGFIIGNCIASVRVWGNDAEGR